jgi:hypothetical protein
MTTSAVGSAHRPVWQKGPQANSTSAAIIAMAKC